MGVVSAAGRNHPGSGAVGAHDVNAARAGFVGGIDQEATVGTPAGMFLVAGAEGQTAFIGAVGTDGIYIEIVITSYSIHYTKLYEDDHRTTTRCRASDAGWFGPPL